MVLLAATAFFFRESPVGVVPVVQMAVGDGLADIVGRRWGSVKWPFSPKKSLLGTTAFVVGGFAVSAALLLLLQVTGCQSAVDLLGAPQVPLAKLLLISIVCAGVELFPVGECRAWLPFSSLFNRFVTHPQWMTI